MPFIEMPIGEVGEQYAAPSGVYDLRIVKQEEAASKHKREEEGEDAEPNMLVLTFVIQSDDYPDAAPFRQWFMYPDGKDGNIDALRMREIKRVLYWFGVAFEENGFNTEDLENAEGSQLPVNKTTTTNGREVNELALDPIPNDGEEGTEEEASAEEEEVAEEEAAVEEEEVAEEEEAPAPRRQTAKPKVVAKKAAPKAAPKAATKKPGRR